MTIPTEDARRKASRLSVERLADGFGERVRVMPVVEVLERRGAISSRQSRAGTCVYEAWALGICGAHDADAGGGGSYDPAGYTDAQLDAARVYREVREAVGGRLWPICFSVVCEDWSPSRWAVDRGGNMHKAAAMELLRLSLDLAADALGLE